MGFYGKVNRTDKVSFTIDRVYTTRMEMEDTLTRGEDLVAIGRYVLIDYNGVGEQYPRLYTQDQKKFYFSRDMKEETRAQFLTEDKYNSVYGGEGFTYFNDYYVRKDDLIFILNVDLDQVFYSCIDNDGIYAKFTKVAKPGNANDYYDNYINDFNTYGNSRGYDATVWQKIYADNKERYVMIAELNSVVPTFDLTIDAPVSDITKETVPHFDKDSTNVYYKLHVRPNWGFRVKPATGTYSTNKEAIYFNAEGFRADKRSHVDKNDEISLKPTGVSEYSAKFGYNAHDPKDPFATTKNIKDIQELSIILPSLGNAVSDMWDLVYGTSRNLNVNWNSTQGLRLTNKDSGYDYNTDSIETLAGCINTTHDLIGMLVKDDIDDIDKANTNNIYYGDLYGNGYNSYYIKNLCYDYPRLDGADLEEWIKQTDPIKLIEFSTGDYYTKTSEGYKKDTTKKYQEGTSYYSISAENIKLDDSYEINKYYYLNEENLNYLLDKNNNPNEKIQYYDIEFIPKTSLNNVQIQTYFYNPKPHIQNEDGTWTGYFYEINEGQIDELVGDGNDPEYNQEAKYYIGYNYTFEMKYVEIDGVKVLKKAWDFGKNNERLSPVNFIPFTYNSSDKTGNYYFKNNNNEYICLTSKEDIDDSISYGKLTLSPKLNKFYEPNLYYYKSGDDFIFATSETMDTNKSYVVLSGHEEPLTHTFYQPNKYYYKDNLAVDRLDTNPVMTPDREYFIKYFAYVLEDTRGILEKGAEWNSNVKDIPPEVTLAKREEYWDWKELVGFGKDLNTIIGLIIRINNLIKFDDFDTRDNHTVQGCINVMNDIINTFATLLPGELMIVDKYGRMASSSWVTDDWIDLEVNNDPINHLITLTHTGPVEKDTRNESNKTPKFGETFEIEDWVFDDRGHQTNISTHTVKIPQGSLIAAAPNGSDIVTQLEFTPATGEIKTVRENLANLELADYIKGNDNGDVTNTDTLGEALGKLQTQIIEEENTRANAITSTMDSLNKAIEKEVIDRNAAIKVETDARIEAINKEITDRNAAIKVETDARIAAINALDATITTENAEVITTITQTDGLVTAGKKKVGELTLTGWTLGENVANNESIADTDTVFNAFAKTQRQINANKAALAVLNGNSSTPGSVAYQIAQIVAGANANFDTLKEIADWIINDTAGVATINSNIADNKKAIEALELLVGDKAVATQIAEAINTALIVEGKDKYALASDLINLSDTVDNIVERVEKLENAVPAEKIAQWDAAVSKEEYETKIAELEQEDYTLNNRCNVLDQEVKNLINKASDFVTLKNYEVKIAELEQANYTLNSRCNVLDKEVKNLINIVAKFETRIAELEAKLK